jgi:hypothetical protein
MTRLIRQNRMCGSDPPAVGGILPAPMRSGKGYVQGDGPPYEFAAKRQLNAAVVWRYLRFLREARSSGLCGARPWRKYRAYPGAARSSRKWSSKIASVLVN